MMADLISRRWRISFVRTGLLTSGVMLMCTLWLAPAAEAVLPDPVHKYTFNDGTFDLGMGTFMDVIGTAHGTLEGAATIELGAPSGELVLDGTAGTRALLDAPTIAINTFPAITLSAWITGDSAANDNNFTTAVGFGQDPPGGDPDVPNSYYFLQTHRGNDVTQTAISLGSDGDPWSEEDFATGEELNDDIEHHYVSVLTNDSISLYIDGELTGSNPVGAANGGNAIDNMISGLSNDDAFLGYLFGVDPLFVGRYNEVRIRNVALTAEEVEEEFLIGCDGCPRPTTPHLVINRDTGEMTFNVPVPEGEGGGSGGAAVRDFLGYTLQSEAGALNQASWLSIADNYDASSGGEVDPDGEWTKLSAASSKTDFSEFTFEGDGGTLTSDLDIPLGSAGAWVQSPFEDLSLLFKLPDGSDLFGRVDYIGNNDVAFEVGDLNFDGAIDELDWPTLRDNSLADLTGMTLAEAYGFGDLDGDLDNDHLDFRMFKEIYEAQPGNGAGSFARLLAGVPEPASAVLLLCGGLLIACRRPVWRPALAVLVALVTAGLYTSPAQAVLTHQYTFNGNANDSAGTAHATVNGAASVSSLGVLTLPGAAADFASLPGATVAINTYTDATFEGWFTRSGAGGGWQRLFDFGTTLVDNGNLGAEYIFYTPASGAGDNRAAISTGTSPEAGFNDENVALGPPDVFGNDEPVSANEQHHVAVRIDSTAGTMDVFVDGVLGDSTPLTHALSGVSTDFAFLGESTYTADANFNGFINEFRIYNHALTDQEIADNAYFGATPSDLLALEVNKTTGQVTLRNTHTSALTIDRYQIDSRGGALDADTWFSLDEQNFDAAGGGEGQSWDESGGSNANTLQELYLAGETTFAADESISLGNAYDTSVFGEDDGDLVFQFTLSATGEQYFGPVTYFVGPPGLPGDYNGDGWVDAADYTVYRDHLGDADESALNGNGDGLNGVDAGDYTLWVNSFGTHSGSGSGSLGASQSTVPEPAGLALAACGLLAIAALGRRSRAHERGSSSNLGPSMERRQTMPANVNIGAWSRPLVALMIGILLATAARAATLDRDYQFGDDPFENPGVGLPVDTDFCDCTGDTEGTTTDFHDLLRATVDTSPVYVHTDVTNRPGAQSGEWGLTFDGNDSVFRAGAGMGSPGIADNDALYQGVRVFDGITTRLMGGWVRPTNAGSMARQDVVNDTAQFSIFISDDDTWGFVQGATTVVSDVDVDFNDWTHVMHRTFGNTAAALYVDGIAVATTGADYDAGFSEASPQLDIVFGASVDRTANFFQGDLDNFTIAIAGDNSDVTNGQNWGEVDLAQDNDFIRLQFAAIGGAVAGDVDMNGVLDPVADVQAFVAGWLFSKQVGGTTIGDLETRAMGDLDFSGEVDLDDAFLLHQALNAAGAGGLNFSLLGAGVPEPSGIVLVLCGLVGLAGFGRRRG